MSKREIVLGIVGIAWWLLAFIGLAGIPDDIRTWGRWIRMLELWIEDPIPRFAVAAVLATVSTILAMLAVAKYPQWSAWITHRMPAAMRLRRRVTTTIDPERSSVELFGGIVLLTVSVFVSMRNLAAETQLERVELTIVMKDGSTRAVDPAGFQGEPPAGLVDVDDVRIDARSVRRGRFVFSRIRDVNTSEVERFELRIQAVGEPLEVHRFGVVDWVAAVESGSEIFLLH